MLNGSVYQRGVTLVELVIALTITGILLATGIPSFVQWTRNAQIRTAAESFQNGLQLARATAVQRNRSVQFQITDTLTSTCALSTSGTNWVVSLNAAPGKCDVAPANPPAFPASPDASDPYIVQAHAAAESSANTVVTAGQSQLIFTGLGRVTPAVAINITSNSGTCSASLRCLRVVVSTNGQIRICEPAVTATGDPRTCP
jgi:type IV fimbrial biogenesis protein FimT